MRRGGGVVRGCKQTATADAPRERAADLAPLARRRPGPVTRRHRQHAVPRSRAVGLVGRGPLAPLRSFRSAGRLAFHTEASKWMTVGLTNYVTNMI